VRRSLLVLAVAAVALAYGSSPSSAAQPVPGKVVTPLPQVSGPIPVTASSHPWNAAAHGLTPIDLGSRGYVEEEYLVSGRANVYSKDALGATTTTASGPYATRILVRRPAAAHRFSGNVVLELNNPTSNYDVDIMWAADHDYFMSRGDVYVGLSVKPVVLDALKAFDAKRYAQVSMANPAPAQTCPQGRRRRRPGSHGT
jgi:hypothetical protein